MTKPMRLLQTGERGKAAILNRPHQDALTGSGYAADGSDFDGYATPATVGGLVDAAVPPAVDAAMAAASPALLAQAQASAEAYADAGDVEIASAAEADATAKATAAEAAAVAHADTGDAATAAAAAADATTKANAAQAAAIAHANTGDAAEATARANADAALATAIGDVDAKFADAGNLTGGTLPPERVPAAAVTQHQAALNVGWSQLSGVPATFPPSAHVHAVAEVTGLQGALDGKAASTHDLITAHPQAGLTAGHVLRAAGGAVFGWAELQHTDIGGLLDGAGKLRPSLLPPLAVTDTFVVASQAAMLALAAESGDIAVRTDLNTTFILQGPNANDLADWTELRTPTDMVTSVNGYQGAVTLGPSDVGASPAGHTHAFSALSGVPAAFPPSPHTHDYASLTGVPATFPPSAHEHAPSDLSGYGAPGGYLRSDGNNWQRVTGVAATDLTGFIPDARVPVTAVTQHQAALSIAIGQVTGLLDGASKILTTLLPAIAITDTFVVASQAAMLALSADTGDVAIRTDLNKSFILRGANPAVLADWQELLTPTDTVTSVNGLTGAVSLTPGLVGAVDPGASYNNPSWITALAGTKITGGIAGNAGTATALATPRTIWGQSFDGSGNVSGAFSGATTGAFSDNVSVGGRVSITGDVLGGLTVGGEPYSHVLVAVGLNGHPLTAFHQVGVYSAIRANAFASGAGSFNAAFESAIGTQDGVFTLEAAASYTVGSLTKGVGSTITRSWGLATYEEVAADHNATIAPLDAMFEGDWFIYYPYARPSTIGGVVTLTGTLALAGSEAFHGATDSFVRLAGGASAGDGAWIMLSGPDHAAAPGRVYVSASGTGSVVQRAGAHELTFASTGIVSASAGVVIAAQAITATTYSGSGTASFGDAVMLAGHEACSGSTSGFVRVAGGTVADGATVLMFGSAHASAPGRLNLTATGPGSVIVRAGITDRLTFASDGLIAAGTGTVHAAQAVTATTISGSSAFGCNGATAQGKATLGAAATDLASALILANNMRTALINNGIGQT